MSIDMGKRRTKVVLDTNVLISAVVYGGKPEEVVRKVLSMQLRAFISPVLRSELEDVLDKRFPLKNRNRLLKQLKKHFEVVHPNLELRVVRDESDNRVIEAAVAAMCDFIVTGDKDLLGIGQYSGIKIVRPADFLDLIEEDISEIEKL